MRMKKLFLIVILTLVSLPFVSAQSGRKIVAAPKPQASQSEDDDLPTYSESSPRPARPRYMQPSLRAGDGQTKSGPPAPLPSNSAPEDVGDDDVVKVETNLVTIPVSVFDRNGLYIPGLRQEDFKIYEDGKEQEIAYFGTTDKPFTVVLLIDVSPSTAYKIDEIHDAAVAFVDQLKPQDSVMVIEFDRGVNVLTDATSDREKIYKAIRKARFGEGTSLYNAVEYSLKKRLSKVLGRKAIVLFTDGVDTTSFKANYDSTLDMAEEADSLIFPIYYNTFFDGAGGISSTNLPGSGPMGRVIRPPASAYALGRKYLEDLAGVTGGRVFRPESTPGGLTAAFEGIAEELRRQYNIGYVPAEEGKMGQRKQIKVRVSRANLVIRARDSYIVGATAQTPAAAPAKTR
jgi:VWFA-related protein